MMIKENKEQEVYYSENKQKKFCQYFAVSQCILDFTHEGSKLWLLVVKWNI